MVKVSNISISTIERLCKYHRILDDMIAQGITNAYSHELAAMAQVTPAQFRRDITSFGNFGNIAKGYDVTKLHQAIIDLLGTCNSKKVALIGLGNLGRTLLSYRGFAERGFEIALAFDKDNDKVGRVIAGRRCFHIDQLEEILPQYNVDMVILATTADGAQNLVNRLGKLGIRAILNFVPKHLVPLEGMFIEQVDISAKLEKLSYLLANG